MIRLPSAGFVLAHRLLSDISPISFTENSNHAVVFVSPARAPDRTVPELSDQEQELLRIFRYLNDKDALLKYARFLKDGEKVSEKKALDA